MKPAPEVVSQRLKSQFAPAYLTLTSIIKVLPSHFLLRGLRVPTLSSIR